MVEDWAPARRRRLGAHGMMFRRRRVFARLREGFTYDEIAAEQGVSSSRIRQIVSQMLQQRAVDSGAEHAKLQLDRLAPAIQLAAEGIAAGDISATALPATMNMASLTRRAPAAVSRSATCCGWTRSRSISPCPRWHWPSGRIPTTSSSAAAPPWPNGLRRGAGCTCWS